MFVHLTLHWTKQFPCEVAKKLNQLSKIKRFWWVIFLQWSPYLSFRTYKASHQTHLSTKILIKFKALHCSGLTVSSVLNLAPCSSSGTEIVFQSGAGVPPSAAGNLFQLRMQLSWRSCYIAPTRRLVTQPLWGNEDGFSVLKQHNSTREKRGKKVVLDSKGSCSCSL